MMGYGTFFKDKVAEEYVELAAGCAMEGALGTMELYEFAREIEAFENIMLENAETHRGIGVNLENELGCGKRRQLAAVKELCPAPVYRAVAAGRDPYSACGADDMAHAVQEMLKHAKAKRDGDIRALDKALLRAVSLGSAELVAPSIERMGTILSGSEDDGSASLRMGILFGKKEFSLIDGSKPAWEIKPYWQDRTIPVYPPDAFTAKFQGLHPKVAMEITRAAKEYGLDSIDPGIVGRKGLVKPMAAIHQNTADLKERAAKTEQFLKSAFTGRIHADGPETMEKTAEAM